MRQFTFRYFKFIIIIIQLGKEKAWFLRATQQFYQSRKNVPCYLLNRKWRKIFISLTWRAGESVFQSSIFIRGKTSQVTGELRQGSREINTSGYKNVFKKYSDIAIDSLKCHLFKIQEFFVHNKPEAKRVSRGRRRTDSLCLAILRQLRVASLGSYLRKNS